MESLFSGLGNIVILIIGGAMMYLMVLWGILPFAIFGVKGKLDSIINLLEDIEQNHAKEAK